MRIDGENEKILLTQTMIENPITENEWKEYSISAIVPDSAILLRLGLVMFGDGEAWYDSATLTFDKDNVKSALRSGGFEDIDTGRIIRSWHYPSTCERAGYFAHVTDLFAAEGKKSLHIYSDSYNRVPTPEIGEIYNENIGAGISFKLPLTVYTDSLNSLPYPSKDLKSIKSSKPDDFLINLNDRTSRLAVTTMFWGFFNQFAMRFDPNCDWTKTLENSLKKAALDNGIDDFRETLSMLIASVNESQSRVWIGAEDVKYGYPFLWKQVDGKVLITKIADSNLNIQPGDEVIAINNILITDLIKNKFKTITGSSDAWKTMRALVEIKAGKKDSQDKVTIKRASDKLIDVNVQRSITLTDLTETRPERFAKLDEGIYYIDATGVTDKGLKKIVNDIKNAKAIIFDLRGNSYLKEDFLGMFSKSPITSVQRSIPIFAKPGRSLMGERLMQNIITTKIPYIKANIFFLADDRSFGQSEIILSLVKFNRLGLIIGSNTAGMPDDIFGINFPAQVNSSVVGIRVKASDGSEIYGEGIKPDVLVTPSLQSIINDNDELLEKAIQMIKK
jgi:hypothetical protein